ncbi:hypothetical protein CXG46_02345 [Nocardioides alpinus]|uniref:Uncharacterized protein n=1 Tax=Nocardioides alpinus TaxID=748909 RepID=A0ABX4R2L5_9ACTN|nr:hypothetical protein CXG46_02345 [Nocardioides alpinus]
MRLLAALVPALLLLPAAAHAEKVVTEDAEGDVVSFAGESEFPDQTVPAPDYAGVDLVRTAVTHGAQRLRVTISFRALERDPFQITVVRVKTPQKNYDISVERLGGKPVASFDGGEKAPECRGLKSRIDLGADVVTTWLPTSCLGAPRWVQVGVGAVAVSADQAEPDQIGAHADDAHRVGEIRDNLALGPKVRRG